MDLSSIVSTVVGAVEAFIESGAIEKVLALLEKIAPAVENIVTNIVTILSK